jgi:elongation factor Ts
MEQIKELRDQTGVSVMQCKKAMEEAEGDMEKALMILKKKSSDIAAKKADRAATDGTIVIKKTTNKAALVMLNCETDFVAKNSDFQDLANALVDIALADGADGLHSKAADSISPVVQKVGENIQLGDVYVFEGDTIGTYVHNGKSGVMVALSGGNEELAKNIAMHIAAMKPEFLNKEAIPTEKIDMMREIFAKEVAESDKPEDIKAKMLQGKIDTYFKEQTLLDQPFIKSPEKTIATLAKDAGATVTKYVYSHIG